MKRFLAVLGCLFVAVAVAHGAPATTTYDVEVLVFENRLPDLEGGELWNRDRADLTVPDLAEALMPSDTLPADAALGNAAAALERDGGYRVLVHRRWRQTAEERSATKPVRLRLADDRLDGTLRFYLSRFLHVDVDLILKEKTGTGDIGYRLSERRRVKTQELNYFDHPKLGVLVRITSTGKE